LEVTVSETTHPTDRATATRSTMTHTTIDWLEAEFPGWTIDLDESSTWGGDLRPLWIARKDGHHPQAELTAAKLHTRLTEYLDRVAARRAMGN
jgi:hypothetical protein